MLWPEKNFQWGLAIIIVSLSSIGVKSNNVSTAAVQYREYDSGKKADTLSSLYGLSVYENYEKTNNETAKQTLKSALITESSPEIIHWWLAKIAAREKRFHDFRDHLMQARALPTLLRNTELASEIYELLPDSEKEWLVKNLIDAGYFDASLSNDCPYFELAKRKSRAEFLYDIGRSFRLTKKIREQLFYELYVLMPETISKKYLASLDGFTQFFDERTPNDFIKRMELLLIFGKNHEARETYQSSKRGPNTLTIADLCELEYLDAKTDRKMRKYDRARERLKDLSDTCPTATQIKARYLNLMLAAMQGDEKSLPDFLLFMDKFKEHSFADDVLLFKANLLLDKNKSDAALAALNELISSYPRGDMVDRALFLQAFLWAKIGLTKQAIDNLTKLKNKNNVGSLDHSQAVYWSARLAIFGDLSSVENPAKEALATSKPLLYGLINLAAPNVYSLLAHSLLSHLGEKVTIRFQSHDRPDQGQKLKTLSPQIVKIEHLIVSGFRKEALALMQDMSLSYNDTTLAVHLASLYEALNRAELAHHQLVRCNNGLAHILSEKIPLTLRKISYPRPFGTEVSFALKRVDVPNAMIYAIMRHESGFVEESISWAGAKGLMQLIYPSALSQARLWGIKNLEEEDLYLPGVNVLLASSLLQNYWQQLGDIVAGLAAYNAGPRAAKKWQKNNGSAPVDTFIENIKFKETRDYVKRVLGAAFAYSIFHDDNISSFSISFK